MACQSQTVHYTTLTTYWQVSWHAHTYTHTERGNREEAKGKKPFRQTHPLKYMHTDTHPTRLQANRHLLSLSHTHTFHWRALGRGKLSSSCEVLRKPLGQIRFCLFLTELSSNLQGWAVIHRDLGLSQCWVWPCLESLLIKVEDIGPMMALLSLWPHVSSRVFVSKSGLYPFTRSLLAHRSWRVLTAQTLPQPDLWLGPVYRSKPVLRGCPPSPDQTKSGLSQSKCETIHLPRQWAQQVLQRVSVCITDCSVNLVLMLERPPHNTHTEPRSTNPAVPLWMMRLCQDEDKWAFITAMISPSSSAERGRDEGTSASGYSPSVPHLLCPRSLRGHKRTLFMMQSLVTGFTWTM